VRKVDWVGLYETETSHRSWAIRVKSVAPFTFDLVAGNLEDSTSRVIAKNLKATSPSDASTSSTVTMDREDCKLEIARTEIGLNVTQTQLCDSIGFPVSGDLSIGDAIDFSQLNEKAECFDESELAVGASAVACFDPL
jgi:hypothetical protein